MLANLLDNFGPGLASLIGASAGIFLTKALDRRTAKKTPKTLERAKAYEAFVLHFAPLIQEGQMIHQPDCEEELRKIIARLALYGESNVVEAVSDFFLAYRSPGQAAQTMAHLIAVIRAMRKSLCTGKDEDVMARIEALLTSLPRPRSADSTTQQPPASSLEDQRSASIPA